DAEHNGLRSSAADRVSPALGSTPFFTRNTCIVAFASRYSSGKAQGCRIKRPFFLTPLRRCRFGLGGDWAPCMLKRGPARRWCSRKAPRPRVLHILKNYSRFRAGGAGQVELERRVGRTGTK